MRAHSTFQKRTQRTKSILHTRCPPENTHWYSTGNTDSVWLWVWNPNTLQVLNSRVSKQPHRAAPREKGKRTGCSSRALLQLGIAGGQKNPLNNPLFEFVTMKGSKHLKTQTTASEQTWQGRDSSKGTRTEPRATGTQSLRSGLAQAFQTLLATTALKSALPRQLQHIPVSLCPHSPAPRAEGSEFSSTLGCSKALEALFLLKNNSSLAGIPWEGRSFGEWRKSLDAENCREKQNKQCVKWKHSPALGKENNYKHFDTSFTFPATQFSNTLSIRKHSSCFPGLTKIQVKTTHTERGKKPNRINW